MAGRWAGLWKPNRAQRERLPVAGQRRKGGPDSGSAACQHRSCKLLRPPNNVVRSTVLNSKVVVMAGRAA